MVGVRRRSTTRPPVGIKIHVDRNTFSAGDTIQGTLDITTTTDFTFTDLDIFFLGTSRSIVERFTPTARSGGREEAFHVFLSLAQPNLKIYYPPHHLLKAGQTYTFPFLFGVPDRLLPRACKHAVVNDAVRDAHLQLPPSFGDNDLMRKLDLPDDLSSGNVSIRYGVYARLSRSETFEDDERETVVLATNARRLRIIPAPQTPSTMSQQPDQPPVRIERTIRNKGLIKSGALIIETERPQTVYIASSPAQRKDSISTTIKVALRFDPIHDGHSPPRLGRLVTLLQTSTFFGTNKRDGFPTRQSVKEDMAQAVHTHHHVLSRRNVASVQWTKVRDQQGETAESSQEHATLGPSKTYKGGVYYVAEVVVPLSLPGNVTFVPTFHSCLMSRVYSLELCLGVQDGNMLSRAIRLQTALELSTDAQSDSPAYDARQRQDSGFSSVDDDNDFARLLSRSVDGQRHGSVLGYGHWGLRVEELPAYTR
ncbi:hypothetical protein BDY17DRAFT_163183 [Neohortaea acidophila]|uniref:Arrestin-like N-terminal domain-containing protein n=1 Tax=Neohortaea acidophila TaxID=245834 RepID=A0A6A6PSG9_9PEZI|nr:uncharacterized protein BDY17DRAFT_163183 [Neohortaea acidophila]KAF2482631.1 hypothetical protein BDY17DRAFT_163183 [Neohortaea acidophila]